MTERPHTPIVAIVGRPNVGKSTLFNRYAGHRRALVADSPGLTRDRIVESIEVGGRRILLVDTAGLDPDAGEGLGRAVQAQAESAIRDADAIVFVVDGKAGLLPEDEAIARTLRRTEKPLLLAVNKIDQLSHHAGRVLEFHGLGFARVHGVSGEHGTGAFEALEALVAALPPEARPAAGDDDERLRLAIVGRPNVGKSSLANRLLGEERVVVSDEGGTTRDAIDVEFEHAGRPLVLVDTAGLRRPGRRRGTGETVGALMTVRALERAEVALLVIDAGEGMTDQDAHVARLVHDLGCAAVIVANKWDLVPAGERAERREAIEHGLRFLDDSPLVTASAHTGSGLRKILPAAIRVAQAAGRQVPTPALNRWLAEVVAERTPGTQRGGRGRAAIKFQYASQVGTHPPAFVLFCSDAESVRPEYRKFLENRLRDAFGFAGTPIRLRIRTRERAETA